jgi:hypothetical protein
MLATAPETHKPCSGSPVAKNLVYGPGPGSSWGDRALSPTRFNTYSRGSTHLGCRNPTLAKCGGEAQHLEKSEDLESSRTLECSELDSKAQNTSHWGVLSVIRKVLKRRYRKWPRIGHLDICRPSYGQKKGRESNWQFDS